MSVGTSDTQTSESGDVMTFFQAVCPQCERVASARPRRKQSTARIDRDTHNRRKHAGEDRARIRKFDAETIGEENPMPVETPDTVSENDV